ncbi:MAG: hypothetical protein AB7G13_32985 [Lautropia sp.]
MGSNPIVSANYRSGSVTTPQGQYSVSGGQVAVPAAVPLDATLFQYTLPASPGSTVRFFVSTIQGKPNWMRVCWNIDAPGALRVVCSRNLQSTGVPVEVDAGHDVSGTILTHRSTTTEPIRWSVLPCNRRGQVMAQRIDVYSFRKIAYDSTKAYGRLLTLPWQYGEIITTNLGSGYVKHDYPTPVGMASYAIQDANRVAGSQSNYMGGTASGTDTCSAY